MLKNKMRLSDFKKRYVKESTEQAAILEMLRNLGAVVIRVNSGMILKDYARKDGTMGKSAIRLADQGTPDIIGYFPDHWKTVFEPPISVDCFIASRPFFWECKRPGGKIRPDQKAFIDKAIADGALAGYGDFSECQKFLKREGIL